MTFALEQSRRLVLPELTGRACRAHPHHTALVFGDEVRTHSELHARAARLASVLAAGGVRAGDRVALLLHNRIEFVESLLACHLLAAVAVPINFRLAPDEVEYVLADSGAVAVICDSPPPDADGVRMVLEVGLGYDDAVASSPPCESAPLVEDDPALMCYTSGTTGRPKGAVLTHRNLVASTLSWIHEMSATEDDVWLSGQPLFHIGGINGLLPFLVLGATVIITPTTTFDPSAILALIEAHRVTMCIFVPTQWAAICESDAVKRIDPRPASGRHVGRFAGAAPDARGDGANVPVRGDRQRLRPDGDVRRDHAAQGRGLDPEDGLGWQADARRRVARRRRRAARRSGRSCRRGRLPRSDRDGGVSPAAGGNAETRSSAAGSTAAIWPGSTTRAISGSSTVRRT